MISPSSETDPGQAQGGAYQAEAEAELGGEDQRHDRAPQVRREQRGGVAVAALGVRSQRLPDLGAARAEQHGGQQR